MASRDLVGRRLGTFLAIISIALMTAGYSITTATMENLTLSAISPSTSLLFGENAFILAEIWLTIIFLITTFLLILTSLISSVFDRLGEMRIWASVGATSLDIATITVMEAIVLGLIGGLLGYVITRGTLIVASFLNIPILPSLPSRLGFQGLLTSLTMALSICMIAAIYPHVKVTRSGTSAVRVRGKFLSSLTRKPFTIKRERLPIIVDMGEVKDLFLFIKSLQKTATPSLRGFHNFWGVYTRKAEDGTIEKTLGFRCDLAIIPNSFSDITLTFKQTRREPEAAEVYISITPSVIYPRMASRASLSKIAEEVREGVESLFSKWRTESKRKIA